MTKVGFLEGLHECVKDPTPAASQKQRYVCSMTSSALYDVMRHQKSQPVVYKSGLKSWTTMRQRVLAIVKPMGGRGVASTHQRLATVTFLRHYQIRLVSSLASDASSSRCDSCMFGWQDAL